MLKVIYQRARLSRVALWWQSDEFKTALVSCAEGPDEGTPVPLPGIPRYLLSALPGAVLGPELLSIVALTITVLDLKEKHDRLAQQVSTSTSAAKTDTLTGLLNRCAFDFDLDGFKAINDCLGHALDDTLLRGYGCWLTRVLGPWGQVYRMGGDEYVLLVTAFPGPPDRFAAWAHERLQILFVNRVSASIGVAWRGEAVSDVIGLADQRMYRAEAARSTPLIDPGDRLAGLTDRSNRHATRAAWSSTGAVRMTSPGEHPASR